MKSIKLFLYYFSESFKEIRGNVKLYMVYILGLCLVSLVQNTFDLVIAKDEMVLRLVSKILFSMVPLLILSKILYVIKIRNFGMAEYGKVLWRFILYNFYYFSLIFLAVAVYFLAATFAGTLVSVRSGFIITSFLLSPLIYIVIFYSLSPYVAVFNDEDESVFAISRSLSSKDIPLVVFNHLFSLTIPLLASSVLLINNPVWKFSAALVFSIPEAIFSILVVLTTAKIYMYLTERG
ncbi:MAG: hypothetical protein WC635_11465 [Bacteriovorax sp.]|jgi:hypothetical protein